MKLLFLLVFLSCGLALNSAGAAPPEGQVDLNTATPAQLMELVGVGPKRAESIVEYRKKKRFRRVRDLLKVRGIGPKRYAQLRDLVRVDRPAPAIIKPQAKLPDCKFRKRRSVKRPRTKTWRTRRRKVRAPTPCRFRTGGRAWRGP